MRATYLTFVFALIAACAGSDTSTPDGGGPDGGMNDAGPGQVITEGNFSRCRDDVRLGRFTVALRQAFSSAQGRFSDGVNPITVFDTEIEEGACRLLRPPSLFCDPGCMSGTTCAADGSCIAQPQDRDFGEITFTGLSADFSVSAQPPIFFYNFTGTLPHPAFDPSSAVTASSPGGDFDSFTLNARGTEAMQTTLSTVAIARGSGADVTWTPQSNGDDVRVEIELNIANHGGTPGRIECLVPDTGSFSIPVVLVDTLLNGTASGFPSLRLTRHGSGAALTGPGCVELRLQSEILLPVDIPGLISCSGPQDCPAGQTCQGDLTCG